jgi:lipopolysaccharide exporter
MVKKITSDIFSLFTTSFFGQLIHVIALPYLTIYFSQEEIGAFFFFQAIIGIGLIIISLQSEQAIVIECNINSYFNFKKSIIILLSLSVVLFSLTYLITPLFNAFSYKTSISSWIMLISPVLLFSGYNNISEYLFTHEKKFKIIAFFRISKPISIYLFAFLFHFLLKDPNNALILGLLCGNLTISLVIFIIISQNKLCFFNKNDFTIKSFKLYYQKHKKILIFNTISTGISSTTTLIPYFFISFIFGEKFTAFYGMTMRIIGVPLGLLGQSFGQVYFQKLSYIYSFKHSLYLVLKKLVIRLYALGIIPFVLLFIFTPQLYQLFLGNGWETSSLLSKVLLPGLLLDMVLTTMSNIGTILGEQKKIIRYNSICLFLRIIFLLLCWKFKINFMATMIIYSVINMGFSIFFQSLFFKLSKIVKPL